MLDRRILKKNARENIKHGYIKSVVVCFICFVLLSGIVGFQKESSPIKVGSQGLYEIVYGHVENIESDLSHRYQKGAIAYLLSETVHSGSFIFAVLNGVNKLIFENKITTSVIIFFSTITLLALREIFIKVFEVGKRRYFLEQRRYYDTKIERILFPYTRRKVINIAYILFLKNIYTFLWSLTIVGGFIKYYEYKMIPYILAENPEISAKDTFALSKKLTLGYKWQLFKMDLSLIGWHILSIFSLGITSVFYSNIYIEALYAECYMSLREKVVDKYTKKYLNDNKLNIPYPVVGVYEESKKVKKHQINFNKNYNFQTLVLLFFSFAIIGWVWEVFLEFLKCGEFINRGTMHGPWLPIYGYGGVAIILLSKKCSDNSKLLFCLTCILCGILEYFTSLYLEVFKGLKYWDYSGYFLNINGRICLEGVIFFGLGGLGFTYLLTPMLATLYEKVKPKIIFTVSIVLVSLYLVDLGYTSVIPNTGERISESATLVK